MSTMPTAMVKTMLASTQRGRYCSGPVGTSARAATTTAKTSCATWLLAPALSAIAVWVGLPLTTKAPLSAAAALAAERPRMSAFSSTRSLCFDRIDARCRGALRDDHDEARGGDREKRQRLAPAHVRPLNDGSPPGTGPITAKPRSREIEQALIGSCRRPGPAAPESGREPARQENLPATKSENAGDAAHRPRRRLRELPELRRRCRGARTPSMSPSIATPTWTPTPVRNPTSTVRDRKSARKPALKMRASRSSAAVSQRQHADQRHVMRSPPSGAICETRRRRSQRWPNRPRTTRWRDEPKTAKATSGRKTV